MPASASSTVWERPVRPSHLPYNNVVLTATSLDASFYDVYSHLAEIHLSTVGIDVEWEDVDVATQEAVRWGDTRGYFSMRLYRLPVGMARKTMGR
jgi:hypothetical protein